MASDAQLVIRGVTVVNPRDGSLRAGQDVRITGDQTHHTGEDCYHIYWMGALLTEIGDGLWHWTRSW